MSMVAVIWVAPKAEANIKLFFNRDLGIKANYYHSFKPKQQLEYKGQSYKYSTRLNGDLGIVKVRLCIMLGSVIIWC